MAGKLNRVIWAAKTVKRSGEEPKTYWTRIGVSFLNDDGSENLSIDLYPTDPNTTIQLRAPEAKKNKRQD